MGKTVREQDTIEEIDIEGETHIVRIRMSNHARHQLMIPLYICALATAVILLLVFLVQGKSNWSSILLKSLAFPIIGGMVHVLFFYKSEWGGMQLIVDNNEIAMRMPSGKVLSGLWVNLLHVQLSKRKLYFRDGTVIKLMYGLSIDLSCSAWNMIIDKAPRDSLLAIAWKDWYAFNDDKLFYRLGRIFSIIAFVFSIGILIYFEAYSPCDFVMPAFLFLLFVCFCFIRNIVFRFREFRGDYSLKE